MNPKVIVVIALALIVITTIRRNQKTPQFLPQSLHVSSSFLATLYCFCFV
jgi:hypothetical protein